MDFPSSFGQMADASMLPLQEFFSKTGIAQRDDDVSTWYVV
jgi:hypothetical protein